jgi:uncharacterized protein (TIGR03435 family)
MRGVAFVIVAVMFLAAATVRGALQTQPTSPSRPAFEVASVKRRIEPGGILTQPQGPRPGGAFGMVNVPVVRLVMYAYDLRDYQVLGGPGWMRTDRFDILAAAGREASPAEMRLMVQRLLEERFRLVAHTERRDMPLYGLARTRPDGPLGPHLKKNDDSCRTLVERPASVPPGAVTTTGCGPMAVLANSASGVMRAPVIDRTGLAGNFEYAFYFQNQSVDAAPNVNIPHYTTALEEALGLKLESARGPVDVLVVDSVQQPTEN